MDRGMLRKMQQQAQELQTRIAKIQEELGNETIEVSAGGGAVKIIITGHQKVTSVKVDPEAVDPQDVESLEDLLMAAVNEAVQKSHELAAKRMGAATGGMGIPGLF